MHSKGAEQMNTRIPALALMALCALVASLASANAAAQFYASLALTQESPATCNDVGASATYSGTLSENLPVASNNVYEYSVVNGGPPLIQFETDPGPFPATIPIASQTVTFGLATSQTAPYTATEYVWPAQNGQPVGTGFRVTITCNADTSATILITDAVPAPAPIDVPALDRLALAGLGTLLAALGLGRLRRRPGAGR
jgi:hypothetical protein